MLCPPHPVLLRLLAVVGGAAGCGETRPEVGRVSPEELPREPQPASSTNAESVVRGSTADGAGASGASGGTTTSTVGLGRTGAIPPLEPAPPEPVEPQPAVYWFERVEAEQVAAVCGSDMVLPRNRFQVCFRPGDTPTAPGVSDVCSPEQAEYTVESLMKSCGLGLEGEVSCHGYRETFAALGPPTAGELPAEAPRPLDAGLSSGVTSEEEACCAMVVGSCPIGRPFTVGGTARRAALRNASDGDWTKTLPSLPGATLTQEQRQLVGQCWLEDARSEHASVAAFARFTLQCLALGAPVEFVLAAQQATRDEIEHAQLSFGLAQRYLGEINEPGPLDIAGALGEVTLASVTLAAVSEGCIAETVSAVLLTAARDAARDSEVKTALSRIVEEELAHAELAWKFLAWALQREPDLAPRVRGTFTEAEAHVGFGELHHSETHDGVLRVHGCLPKSELAELARDALRDIVRPAAAALLG